MYTERAKKKRMYTKSVRKIKKQEKNEQEENTMCSKKK